MIDLSSLARANLLTAGLIRTVEQLHKDEAAQWILELAHVHEAIAVEPAMILLNEAHSVASFPAITDLQTVDAQFRSQRQYYRQVVKKVLNQLSSRSLLDIVTVVVNEANNHGRAQTPILIDGLVDGFELEAQGFFKMETQMIKDLIQRTRRAAERNEGYTAISRLSSQLEGIVKNWDWVTQPIQLSTQSRGSDHDLSHKIVQKIRDLEIDLFNEHGLLAIPWKLTVLQQEDFAEITSIVEQAEEETTAFNDSAQRRYKRLASSGVDR